MLTPQTFICSLGLTGSLHHGGGPGLWLRSTSWTCTCSFFLCRIFYDGGIISSRPWALSLEPPPHPQPHHFSPGLLQLPPSWPSPKIPPKPPTGPELSCPHHQPIPLHSPHYPHPPQASLAPHQIPYWFQDPPSSLQGCSQPRPTLPVCTPSSSFLHFPSSNPPWKLTCSSQPPLSECICLIWFICLFSF